MSWLFPRKMKWRDNILIDATTGEILAAFGGEDNATRVDTWEGYWRMGSQRYISKDHAKAAAERMFR